MESQRSFWLHLGWLLAVLLAFTGAFGQTYVMMPDSTNNRLVLFDPETGSVVNNNLFGLAGGTPLHALQVGNEIWVSEQLGDRVSRWSFTGDFLGALGPSGLDNIRGMALIDGVLYVTNAGTANGAPGPAIVKFDASTGTPLGFFSTAGLAPSPFGILRDGETILVSSASANDDIHRFDLNGNSLGTFHNSTALNFVEQMAFDADGNILAAGFSSNNVVVLDRDTGAILRSFSAPGARGVFQLRNGNILWTNSSGAHVYNPSTGTSTLVYAGGGRYLDLLALRVEGDINGDGCVDDADLLQVLFAFGQTGAELPEDVNGDGVVDDADLLVVLFNFGQGC
ncbi:MAG: hypothetical protein N2045_09475 [Fimbriimonadales bacterium]|nr:hypothetical protein [Fimbriimonadales bacterium]